MLHFFVFLLFYSPLKMRSKELQFLRVQIAKYVAVSQLLTLIFFRCETKPIFVKVWRVFPLFIQRPLRFFNFSSGYLYKVLRWGHSAARYYLRYLPQGSHNRHNWQQTREIPGFTRKKI